MINIDQIAMEDFKAKFLAVTAATKKAADAAIGSARSGLAFMAKKQGRDLQLVDPRWTKIQGGQRWTVLNALREPSTACHFANGPISVKSAG